MRADVKVHGRVWVEGDDLEETPFDWEGELYSVSRNREALSIPSPDQFPRYAPSRYERVTIEFVVDHGSHWEVPE